MITLGAAALISQRCMDTLRPDFRVRVIKWYVDCCESKLTPYVYQGYRSDAEQSKIYASGRTTPGPILTHATPGQSFHGYGLAIDWVPIIRSPKVLNMYEDAWDKPDEESLYHWGQELGIKYNLRLVKNDNPHLEDGNYASHRDLAHLPAWVPPPPRKS